MPGREADALDVSEPDRGRASGLAQRLSEGLTCRLAVDPRGLAALRISLGLLILADLGLRSPDLVAFYTDAGVLPRSVLRAQFGGLATLAFAHGLSGALWVQGLLFVIAGIAAVALVLGYRTRVATVISVLLLVSLHARNPLLLNAGDSLLRRQLIWGLFLPLGGRWSVDAISAGRRTEPIASLATVALLLQVVIVYLVNGVLKLRGEAWRSGEAILLVFQLDHLTVRLGDALGAFPLLLQGLGWLWLLLLLASPLLLVLRGWPRGVLVAGFVAMHFGMALTLRLGLFPLISIAALLPFLPPPVWNLVTDRFGQGIRRPLLGSGWGTRLERSVSDGPRFQFPRRHRRAVSRLTTVVVAVLLVTVLVWNAASLGYVSSSASVAPGIDPGDRRWDMFAPNPRTNDGWFVVPGELESGRTIDAFHGGPVTDERPPELARTFPSHRWFVYLLELPHPGAVPLRAAFADYLCRRWNADHDDELVAVTITYQLEQARVDGTTKRHQVELGRYECAG